MIPLTTKIDDVEETLTVSGKVLQRDLQISSVDDAADELIGRLVTDEGLLIKYDEKTNHVLSLV